jgi:hypothetical protein
MKCNHSQKNEKKQHTGYKHAVNIGVLNAGGHSHTYGTYVHGEIFITKIQITTNMIGAWDTNGDVTTKG